MNARIYNIITKTVFFFRLKEEINAGNCEKLTSHGHGLEAGKSIKLVFLPASVIRGHGISTVLFLVSNSGLLMYPVISEKSSVLRREFFSFPEQ